MPPIIISATDFQYSGVVKAAKPGVSAGHKSAITNAGIVKIAPAATDSPIDPTVRAMFSSSSEPFIRRSSAMPITAAG